MSSGVGQCRQHTRRDARHLYWLGCERDGETRDSFLYGSCTAGRLCCVLVLRLVFGWVPEMEMGAWARSLTSHGFWILVNL